MGADLLTKGHQIPELDLGIKKSTVLLMKETKVGPQIGGRTLGEGRKVTQSLTGKTVTQLSLLSCIYLKPF